MVWVCGFQHYLRCVVGLLFPFPSIISHIRWCSGAEGLVLHFRAFLLGDSPRFFVSSARQTGLPVRISFVIYVPLQDGLLTHIPREEGTRPFAMKVHRNIRSF